MNDIRIEFCVDKCSVVNEYNADDDDNGDETDNDDDHHDISAINDNGDTYLSVR